MIKIGGTERSSRIRSNQVSSETTGRTERYSTSAEDETDGCFLDFQEMGTHQS